MALFNVITLLTGADDLEIDFSDERTLSDMLSVINKPSLELYSEPISISNSIGEELVSVSAPEPKAVAFSAAFANILEYVGMLQKAAGGDINLSPESINELGRSAIKAATVSDDNPDGIRDMDSALEKVIQAGVEPFIFFSEGVLQQLNTFVKMTAANVEAAIVNGENLEQLLINNSLSLQNAEFSNFNDTDNDGIADMFDAFPEDASLVCNGDVDGDGRLSISDALYVLEMSGKTLSERDLIFGDVAPLINGRPSPDGELNAADALVILRRVQRLVSW